MSTTPTTMTTTTTTTTTQENRQKGREGGLGTWCPLLQDLEQRCAVEGEAESAVSIPLPLFSVC